MERLYVSIADTPYKQAQGLMFVKEMDENRGMLFVFSHAQNLRFWGQNTYIPLDVAFADSNGIIREIGYIVPLSEKSVACSVPCKYAIEANSGYFASKKIEIGDKIEVHQNGAGGYVEFSQSRRNSIRTSGSFTARRILSQLMDEEYAYGLDEPPEQQPTASNVPSLRKEDIWQYLEDDFDKPEIDIDPMQDQQQEDLGEYPLDLEQKPQPEVEYPQFGNVFDATEWAQQNREMMRISYRTQHGSNIVRDVEPHGQFHAETTGRQILVTYDATVGDIRAFILTNIGSFAFTGEQFEPKFQVV